MRKAVKLLVINVQPVSDLSQSLGKLDAWTLQSDDRAT